MIELQQLVIIERHDSEGWGKTKAFESVWVAFPEIESILVAGITRLRMKSGDVIDVSQTPQEIFRLAFGENFIVPSYKWLGKEQPHGQ